MGFEAPEKKTIPEMEDSVLSFWKQYKIFEKSVEERSDDNPYVFYDGPPFISGLPHYGHLLGSVAKDLIPRYWTMKGKKVERVWGWDAHGLTIENKVQKRLGIKTRRDIESFGLEKFTQECYDYTSEVSAEWEWYIDKIGRWVDFRNAYKTTDQTYMETVMWVFKQLYDKGLIYEGVRSSLYCGTCGTPVSNFEIAMDNSYKEVEALGITVKFKLKDEENTYALAWTTTPWTVPGNLLLAIGKEVDYVKVKYKGNFYILAATRVEFLFKNKDYEVVGKVRGEDLADKEYEPPFENFSEKRSEGCFKIIYSDHANSGEGTGIVHLASFGEEDFLIFNELSIEVLDYLDDENKFLNIFPLCSGKFYLDANKKITEELKSKGKLFESSRIVHRVPYHDRCDTVLIYRPQNAWFVKVSDLKERLLKNNEHINWVPNHLKHGRFAKGIEQAPDWCISRNRFWATPMPVWEAEDGDKIVVSSIKELEELSGQKVKDLHRPYIDEIVIEKDGKTYKRRKEVLDSWMEAGSMPYSQIHYPFENREKFDENFPGDYIVEYISQVRAWFYVMHILSTALFDTNSFKNVISTGVMAGSDGRKMSKTYGNYTDPKEALEKYGGDALRLYLMGSPLMVGENANFNEEDLRTKLRNVLNPLWNSMNFFLLYASQHNWEPDEYESSYNDLDKWIVVRLNETIRDISTNIENYLVPPAVKAIEDFVDDLSRWYVRRSRKRISHGDEEALSTLYHVLVTFCKAAAPVIPFMTENIYRQLVDISRKGVPESVHLCEYPAWDEDLVMESEKLIEGMKNTREVVSLALFLRSEKGLKVRQPLATLFVQNSVGEKNGLFVPLILDEVNVKRVERVKDVLEESETIICVTNGKFRVCLDISLSDDLKLEGLYREMVRKIQDLRKKEGLQISDKVAIVYVDSNENRAVVEKFGEALKLDVYATSLKPGDEFSIRKV